MPKNRRFGECFLLLKTILNSVIVPSMYFVAQSLQASPLRKSFLLHGALAALFLALAFSKQPMTETSFSVPLEVQLSSSSKPQSVTAPRSQNASQTASLTAPAPISATPASPSSDTFGAQGAAPTENAQKSYLSELRAFIEQNKHYPPQAKTLGHEGRSEVKFSILADGTVCAVELSKSSGSDILDEAALALLQRARKLSPFPEFLKMDRLNLVLPIEYSLN